MKISGASWFGVCVGERYLPGCHLSLPEAGIPTAGTSSHSPLGVVTYKRNPGGIAQKPSGRKIEKWMPQPSVQDLVEATHEAHPK
jgi:hypothetical protein